STILPGSPALSISSSLTPGFGNTPHILSLRPESIQYSMVTALTILFVLSEKGILATTLAPACSTSLFMLICELIHILRDPTIVTTGLPCTTVLNSSLLSNAVTGNEGERNQG